MGSRSGDWFEDDREGATWPGHHMAVAIPLKPKTKIVWGKRPHVDDEGEVDPGAKKLSMTEKKKDDMEVDQEGSRRVLLERASLSLGVLRLGRQTRVRLLTSKVLPLRSTARLLQTMCTAGREMIEGSFPRTLRLTWRSRCLLRQRS